MMILYKDKDIVLSMEWYSSLQGYGLHTKVTRWSVSNYKKWILEFGKVLNKLEKMNITKLYAIPSNAQEEKWEELFGFSFSGKNINGYKIMELDYGN